MAKSKYDKVAAVAQALRAANIRQSMNSVPTKRSNKTKVGKAAPAWHLASVRGVPGGSGKSLASVLRMVTNPRTGTRVATDQELARLRTSARNANTTQTRTYEETS